MAAVPTNYILIQDPDGVIGEENVDEEYEEFELYEVDDEEEENVVLEPRVSQEAVANFGSAANVTEEEKEDSEKKGVDETSSCNDKVGSQEWSRSEIEGLFCPICMEAWTNGGNHQVCCLPCGHIYGLSCIQRWIRQHRGSGSAKCPQCNRKCKPKDVRVLYASRIVVVDEELQKKIRTLEAKCVSLEKKHSDCCKKEVEGQRREAELRLQVHQLTERTSLLEGMLGDNQRRHSGSIAASWGSQGRAIPGCRHDSEFGKRGCSSSFVLKKEFQVEGARFFDVDASSHIILLARRLTGTGGMHGLTKISLIAPHERENIQLPSSIKAVRDLHLSPHGRLALLASLGKKLSVVSTESNNTILSYDLTAAAWSCSWDINSSHYAYAGLQNGMLLVFDMRQTRGPVESLAGLTCNPVHSLHSLSPNSALSSGVRTLLTASSVGLCEWNTGGVEERPLLVPGSENQGVCISLACCPSSDEIVASFRPKVEMPSEVSASQAFPTPATSLMGHCVMGSHVSYKRLSSQTYQRQGSTCAHVDEIRLPKSAIIDSGNNMSLFASGDEVAIVLQELPSLMAVQRLNPRKLPVRDVKFMHVGNSDLLTCLCDDMLQLFSPKLS